MKKLLFALMALFLMAGTVETYAQNKQLEKERKKEYKKQMKRYKKEDWKLFASSRSFEVTLLTHFDKLNAMGEDANVITGIASKFKSKNVGRQVAANSAAVEYARAAGAHVKGRVVSDIFGDGVEPTGEFDRFYAAYETAIEKEIKGEMQHSYSVIRELGDGTFELEAYYIVNETAASRARMRAYENALKESEAAQRYADKVANFVREGFKAE